MHDTLSSTYWERKKKHSINLGRWQGRGQRAKVLKLGRSWSKAEQHQCLITMWSWSNCTDTLIHYTDICGQRGSYYMSSKIAGMENTPRNKFDKVSVADQISRLFYMPQPPSSRAEGVCLNMILQSLCSLAVDAKKLGCSRWCNHKVLKPSLSLIPEWPGGTEALADSYETCSMREEYEIWDLHFPCRTQSLLTSTDPAYESHV